MNPFLRRVMAIRAREQAMYTPDPRELLRLDEERMRMLDAQTQPRHCFLCKKPLRGENVKTKLCTKCGGVKKTQRLEREGAFDNNVDGTQRATLDPTPTTKENGIERHEHTSVPLDSSQRRLVRDAVAHLRRFIPARASNGR